MRGNRALRTMRGNRSVRTLSSTEEQIKNYLLEGLTSKDIALRRFVSVGTVRAQMQSIYRKLSLSRGSGLKGLLALEKERST